MRSLQSELKRHGLKGSAGRTRRVSDLVCKPSRKTTGKMTDRDWAELRGTNRDTYKRVNGRVKRR